MEEKLKNVNLLDQNIEKVDNIQVIFENIVNNKKRDIKKYYIPS